MRRGTALLAQVGAALDAAHARGLIHRDVKPANVLIEERDGREHAYLTDFGLTKAVGSTAGGLTATGQFVGTVDFIAPEQVMGRRVDARADVYSLGCVLFTVLTGRVPFERDSEVSKIFAHVNDPPPSLLDASPEAPAELDEVVHRALEKDPDARFRSAGDLARAALAAAEGRSTPAGGGSWRRGLRSSRRLRSRRRSYWRAAAARARTKTR
jgi:serine/threonine-protein kinase